MAQLTDDCFAFGGALLPLEDAQARIAALYSPATPVETIPLAQADGRVLAYDVPAPIDLPPWHNSAVDGYALRHADLHPSESTTLPLAGRIPAGGAPLPLPPTTTIRVFTGAPMPDGADTVMMQEDVEETQAGIRFPPGLKPGANARPAGEDIPKGARALPAGKRLTPPDIGLLAALGLSQIQVRAPLRVALFSTGDELASPPAPLARGQVYDANRHMLAALLRRLHIDVIDGGILPDNPEATATALQNVSAHAILTSGGVSTGEEDHVRAAIQAAGQLEFWRVAIKPGRPVALARIGNTPLLGLPGNPVAALVTLAALGRPLLDRLAGATYTPPPRFPLPALFPYKKKPGRREYVRVTLSPQGASRYPKEGAGILTSLTESDALMELPEAMTRLAPGDIAPVIPIGLLYA